MQITVFTFVDNEFGPHVFMGHLTEDQASAFCKSYFPDYPHMRMIFEDTDCYQFSNRKESLEEYLEQHGNDAEEEYWDGKQRISVYRTTLEKAESTIGEKVREAVLESLKAGLEATSASGSWYAMVDDSEVGYKWEEDGTAILTLCEGEKETQVKVRVNVEVVTHG